MNEVQALCSEPHLNSPQSSSNFMKKKPIDSDEDESEKFPFTLTLRKGANINPHLFTPAHTAVKEQIIPLILLSVNNREAECQSLLAHPDTVFTITEAKPKSSDQGIEGSVAGLPNFLYLTFEVSGGEVRFTIILRMKNDGAINAIAAQCPKAPQLPKTDPLADIPKTKRITNMRTGKLRDAEPHVSIRPPEGKVMKLPKAGTYKLIRIGGE